MLNNDGLCLHEAVLLFLVLAVNFDQFQILWSYIHALTLATRFMCCLVWYTIVLLINFSVVGCRYILQRLSSFVKCCAKSCTLKRVVNVLILIKFLLSITFDMSSCWYQLLTAVAVCIVSVALTNDL